MSFHKSTMGRGSDWGRNDHTLADYLRRKNQQDAFDVVKLENKLTFEEWAEDSQIPYRSVETKQDLWDYLQLAWKAAQENI